MVEKKVILGVLKENNRNIENDTVMEENSTEVLPITIKSDSREESEINPILEEAVIKEQSVSRSKRNHKEPKYL